MDAHEYWDPDAFKVYLWSFCIIHMADVAKMDIELVWDNPMAFYPAEHELYLLAEYIRQQAAPIVSSLANIPRSEEGGSAAAFEPTIEAIQSLLDGKDGENERSLLSNLLSTIDDPSSPLVDALVKQNIQAKPISSRTVVDQEPYTNGRSAPSSPRRRDPRTPHSGNRLADEGMASGGTPITEASLRRHLADTGAFSTREMVNGAPSIAGSERKRKRDEYEGHVENQSPLRFMGQNGTSSSPTQKAASPQRKKVSLSEDVANGSAGTARALTKAQKKEIAKQKERERRGT